MAEGSGLGDRGQRYEVWCDNGTGKRMKVGWTGKKNGGALVRGIRIHPAWRNPVVIDRTEKKYIVVSTKCQGVG